MVQDSCRSEAPEMAEVGLNHQSRCFFRSTSRKNGAEQILDARELQRLYGSERRKYLLFGPRVSPPVRALNDVAFRVDKGRTLGIVGESGSGKTTVARSVVGLLAPSRGEIRLRDSTLAGLVEQRTSEERAALRMVFQNPTASLNPKLPIRHTIMRSLRRFAGLDRRESRVRAAELLQAVGLHPSYLDRPPGELSGGEQQRAALAGAFAANPDVIVADEAVSSLDVSVQAQVLNVLEERQQELGNSYIFITHDLGVVRYISDDILVLYAGHVAEYGPAESVLDLPSHPYTEALLSAAPVPDPDAAPPKIRLSGAVPTMREAFRGCFFAGRCPRKIGPICDETPPPARTGPDSPDHTIYCHIPVDELATMQRETDNERVP